jgi:DNA-binding ferritin-like protein
MDISEFIQKLIEHQINLKIIHWQTESYSVHKATGHLYESLDEFLDKFAEVWMGFENVFSIAKIEIEPKNASQVIGCVEDLIDLLQTAKESLDPKESTVSSLINLIDGMQEEAFQGLYKLKRFK